MVRLVFRHQGQQILELTLERGSEPQMNGDGSWLDFSFAPHSQTLGRPVTYEEDPEEWGRSLAAAYEGTPTEVELVADEGAKPQPAHEPAQQDADSASQSTTAYDAEDELERRERIMRRQARRFRIFKIAIGLLLAAAIVWWLGGPTLVREKGPGPQQVLTSTDKALQTPKAEHFHYTMSAQVNLELDSPSLSEAFASGGSLSAEGDVGPGYGTADLKIEGTDLSYEGKFVSTGGKAYVQYNKRWFELPSTAAQAATSAVGFNPKEIASHLDAEVFSGPTMDGVKTWQLDGRLNPDSLSALAALASGMPGSLKVGELAADTQVELVVGQDDDLPRRLWLHLDGNPLDWIELPQVSNQQGQDPTEGLEGRVAVDLEFTFSDWGKPVKVQAPAKAKPLGALLRSPAAPMLPGMPQSQSAPMG